MIKNSIFYSFALILLTFFSFPAFVQAIAMPNTSNADSSKFATFFIYGTNTIAYDYNIYLNDSVICSIKNKTKYAIKVYKEGIVELSSKAKEDRKIKVTIKFGQEYYLKCEHSYVNNVLFWYHMQPEINLMLSEQGRLEFENLDARNAVTAFGQDTTISNTTNADTSKFATFYIYRPNRRDGSHLNNYNIYLNDSIICRIKNNTKYPIKIYTAGAADFSLKNKKTKIKINVKFGQEYYMKCGAIPGITFVHPEQGRFEFENLDARNALKEEKNRE